MFNDKFSWIGTWKITNRCNLRCSYCDSEAMCSAATDERIDYEKAIAAIASFAPYVLNISGGEPTLVPDLHEIVKKIKGQWNPYIRIVHNGSNPSRIVPSLPWIDRFVVSIDGPGEINKATKGLDGDAVLERLARAFPTMEEHGVDVAVNCVLTTENAKSVSELALKTAAISPKIVLSFTPLMPPGSELSVTAHPDVFESFLAEYRTLKANGYTIIHTFDTLTRHKDYKRIQCYNQYFTVRFRPDGAWSTCIMRHPGDMTDTKRYAKKALNPKNFGKAVARARKIVECALSPSPVFDCHTICVCEGWLDLLFLNQQSDCLRQYMKGLQGRITEEEIERMTAFVQKHINSSFDPAFFRKYLWDGKKQPARTQSEQRPV